MIRRRTFAIGDTVADNSYATDIVRQHFKGCDVKPFLVTERLREVGLRGAYAFQDITRRTRAHMYGR